MTTNEYDLLVTTLDGKETDNPVHLFAPDAIFAVCGYDAFTDFLKIGRISILPKGNTVCDRCKELTNIPTAD